MWDVDRRYLLAGLVVFLIISFFAGTKYGSFRQEESEPQIMLSAAGNNKTTTEETSEIQVYVDGEVERAGLYKLKNGARVYDALEMAGILPAGDMRTVQPARKLLDGETITLYAEGELPPSGIVNSTGGNPGSAAASVPTRAAPSAGLVNINTATAGELEELPGIGPALARRIIDYRNSSGGFAAIEDINNVSGIGDKKFADIKDLITVR